MSATPAAGPGRLAGAAAIRVFACFAGAYFMSFAMRSVNAVIAPELVRDFGLGHAQLGSLSSAYFLGFAAMQLPLGVWLDRFGARRTHATLLLSAVAGCALFAAASEPLALWIGRFMIGAGVAGALMSALKAFRFWYAPERQQQLAAWMLVVGNFGALATTVPVQAVLPAIGWRGVFWIAFALLLASVLAIQALLPRDEERAAHAHTQAAREAAGATGGSVWRGYRAVFSERYLWRLATVNLLTQSGFMAMQTLWAGPWFARVLGLSPDETARALLGLNLAMMFAYLAIGWIVPRLTRAGWPLLRIIAICLAAMMLTEVAIANAHSPHAWVLWLVLGAFATPFTLVQTHVAMCFPPSLTGRAFTALNLIIFSGAFAAQWLFGVGVDAFRASGLDEGSAFRHTMVGWMALQAVAMAVLLGWRVQPRSAQPG